MFIHTLEEINYLSCYVKHPWEKISIILLSTLLMRIMYMWHSHWNKTCIFINTFVKFTFPNVNIYTKNSSLLVSDANLQIIGYQSDSKYIRYNYVPLPLSNMALKKMNMDVYPRRLPISSLAISGSIHLANDCPNSYAYCGNRQISLWYLIS